MRVGSAASVLLAIISFTIGSYLIIYGMILWNDSIGIFVPYAPFGAILVFMSLPTALFGFKALPRWAYGRRNSPHDADEDDGEDDSPLFSNKRIMGLSLVITGLVWLVVVLFRLSAAALIPCSTYGGCPTAFTLFFSLGNLILISIGVMILVAGIFLVLTSRSKSPKASQKAVRASLARLVP